MQQTKAEKLRFLAVGLTNTAIDFILLFLLTHTGLYVIVANYISTTIAFVFSFAANKKFTFKTKNANLKRELAQFLIVSLIAAWIIQPVVILGVTSLAQSLFTVEGPGVLLIAKILATIAAISWNYVLYSRVVFKHADRM